MSAEFFMKRGDTSPALRYALEPTDITLAGATVRFQMRRRNGPTVIDAPGQIVSETPPVVEYDWPQQGDTETAGVFSAEFRVQYVDGAVETFPNKGFIEVVIGDDVPGVAS